MQMQTVTTAFYCRIADVYHVLPYFYNATQTTANTPTNDVTSHLIAEKFGNEVCVRLMGAGTTAEPVTANRRQLLSTLQTQTCNHAVIPKYIWPALLAIYTLVIPHRN